MILLVYFCSRMMGAVFDGEECFFSLTLILQKQVRLVVLINEANDSHYIWWLHWLPYYTEHVSILCISFFILIKRVSHILLPKNRGN